MRVQTNKRPFYPPSSVKSHLQCPTANRQWGSYCHWLRESWVASSFFGKLSSSWIRRMSLLVSSAWELTFRSPINSSVKCRRAALKIWGERHQDSNQFDIQKRKRILLIYISPFIEFELIQFPALSPPPLSGCFSSDRLHAHDQSTGGNPDTNILKNMFNCFIKYIYVGTQCKTENTLYASWLLSARQMKTSANVI